MNTLTIAPHSAEAEISVLGACLQDAPAAKTACELLTAGDFFDATRAEVFSIVRDLATRGTPPDLVSAYQMALDRKATDWITATLLQDLVDKTPTVANIAHHCRLVRDLSARRQAAALFTHYAGRARADGADLAALAAEAQERLGRLTVVEGSEGPVVVRLSDVTPEPVTWLWPGRIARGKLTLVVGDPGLGKSYLTQDVAARITRGLPWPDGSLAPRGDVVILTAEDGLADTIRPRFDALGGDPGCVHVLTAIRTRERERGVDLSQDLPHLEALLARVKPLLVVVDPVSAYVGKTDTYRDNEVRAVLAPVAGLAEHAGTAIVGVMHLTKSQQRQAIHRTQGNVAFVAAARAVFAVAEDREDSTRRLFLPVKMNIAPKPPGLAYRLTSVGVVARLQWEADPVDVSADDALAGPELPGERSEREEAVNFVRDLLADGPVSATDVKKAAREAGIAERTLFRAKTDLAVKVEKTGFRDGWTWSLSAKAAKNAEDCHIATHAEVGNLGSLRGEAGNLREVADLPDLEEVGGLWEAARS